MFDLYDVAKIAIGLRHNSFDRICTLGELCANPIKATVDRLLSFFDSASESSRESGIISMGPECLECCRSPVLQFELRGVNLRYHCLKLLTGGGLSVLGLPRVGLARPG